MKKEEKLKRLLEMQNDPELFTEEEIRLLMEDEECRQYYEQMVRAADCVFASDAIKGIREAVPHGDGRLGGPTRTARGHALILTVRKMAAVFVGVAMLSVIAYAAIHYTRNRLEKSQTEYSETKQPAEQGIKETTLPADSTVTTQPKTFENVPLKEIVEELAAHYHLKVDVRNGEAAVLRLYYPWNPEMSPSKVADELNRFEKVSITINDSTFIIE